MRGKQLGRGCVLLLLASAVTTGCVAKATDQEIEAMCENLVKLRGEVNTDPVEKLIADVKESYQREEKRLEAWKARDLKGWDDELAAKLNDAKDDAEKAALTEEYTKKKEVTASKHDPDIQALPGKMAAAIEEAKKKAEDNKAAFKAAVDECIGKAKTEGVSQKAAQCRIKATSTDQYWNACR